MSTSVFRFHVYCAESFSVGISVPADGISHSDNGKIVAGSRFVLAHNFISLKTVAAISLVDCSSFAPFAAKSTATTPQRRTTLLDQHKTNR